MNPSRSNTTTAPTGDRPVSRVATELALEPPLELGPIGETGEWIVERLVRQLGEAVLESLGHRVHDACHGTELPVTLDLDAMSQTVDRELFEPQLEVPERDVERPAEMSQDEPSSLPPRR